MFVAFFLLGTGMLILNHVVTELGAGGPPGRRRRHRAPGLLPRAAHPGEPGGRGDHVLARGRPLLRDSPGGPGGAAAAGPTRAHGDRVLGPRGPGQLRRASRATTAWSCACYLADQGSIRPRCPGCAGAGWRSTSSTAGRGRARRRPRRYMRRTATGDFGLGLLRGHGPGGAPGDLPGADRQRRGLRGAARAAARDALAEPGGGRHGTVSPCPTRARGCTTSWSPRSRDRPAARERAPAVAAADRRRSRALPAAPAAGARDRGAWPARSTAGSADARGHGPPHQRVPAAPTTATRSRSSGRPRSTPLEEFLFVRRSGNCEYFAAAMAVMLRSLGVPPGWPRASSRASGTRTAATSWCA